jgi:hypothetical protein
MTSGMRPLLTALRGRPKGSASGMPVTGNDQSQESWFFGRRPLGSKTSTRWGRSRLHVQRTRFASRSIAPRAKLGTRMPAKDSRSWIAHEGGRRPRVAKSIQPQAMSSSDTRAEFRPSPVRRSMMSSQSTSQEQITSGSIRRANPWLTSLIEVTISRARYRAGVPFGLNRPPRIAAPSPENGLEGPPRVMRPEAHPAKLHAKPPSAT